MKRALREISEMTTSLEASGIERPQAGATLEAIANSIEKFAVTPERLRQALDASQQTLYERIKGEMDQRFDDLTENVNQRFNALRQQQHADSTKLFNLMLAIAMGMAGVVGGLVLNKLF